MHPADKAVLRLAIGLGLAVLVAYGFAMQGAFVVCAGAVLILCKPGPPIPFVKGAVMAAVIAALVVTGVLMVPILENFRVSGVALTGTLLYAIFFAGARRANPLTIFLVIAITVIPVAGVAEQSLAIALGQGLGVGIGIGVLTSGIGHALFPDAPVPGKAAASPASVSAETARWMALQATVVVIPVFVLALVNPALYFAAIMKTVTLGQQAGATNARSAGHELVGSTLVGALVATVVWFGLSMRPNLWMLMLWVVAATFWTGRRLYRVKPTSEGPSFWLNVLLTIFILLGPAIEDSANGKDVYTASAIRISLFVLVALYGWVTVWAFERWRDWRSRSRSAKRSEQGPPPVTQR